MTTQAVTTALPGDLHWRYSVPPRTDSKMLLLTVGEVAVIGSWYGTVGEHFLAWCPLPKKQPPTPVPALPGHGCGARQDLSLSSP